MSTYISLLRGINVSGQKLINMPDLVKLYENLGFTDVKTYIQSGNVIFTTNLKTTNSKLEKLIEQKIKETYSFQVPVVIRTVYELEQIVSINPYINEQNRNGLYLTFLSDSPNSIYLDRINELSFLPDTYDIINKEIYLNVAAYGMTKLNNNFFENKLKVSATTRNWKTVNKLLAMAKEL